MRLYEDNVTKDKKLLVNKTSNQIRIACIENKKLYDLEVEQLGREQKVDSIFNAEVLSVAPSLQAAFLNYSTLSKKNGFLSVKQIAPEFYPDGKKNINMQINDVIKPGQKILVQMEREEIGTKGAALSTYISLPGSYLVLMPNNPKVSGISRRIDGKERDQIKKVRDMLSVPDSMGVIIRTAGINKSLNELQWDLDILINLWGSIKKASSFYEAPHLIHKGSDILIRAVRDHLSSDLDEIIVDDKDIYDKLYSYLESAKSGMTEKIRLYKNEDKTLFSNYNVESQIEFAYQRSVRLPSGGEIVIDRSEALTSIDVNSAKATSGSSVEETAINTNIEAAKEISYQLRIRDLGGLFVIDFIDMENEDNIKKLEKFFKDLLKLDRARTSMSEISQFGLLEMSRQRLRSELNERVQVICPRCHGHGNIRNVRSLSTSIINLIEENALINNVGEIQVQVPIEVATYILNEKRALIEKIEKNNHIDIFILPSKYLNTPDYEIKTIKKARKENVYKEQLSYELINKPNITYETDLNDKIVSEQAAVNQTCYEKSDIKNNIKKTGFLNKVLNKIFFWKNNSNELEVSDELIKSDKNKIDGKKNQENKHKRYYKKDFNKSRKNKNNINDAGSYQKSFSNKKNNKKLFEQENADIKTEVNNKKYEKPQENIDKLIEVNALPIVKDETLINKDVNLNPTKHINVLITPAEEYNEKLIQVETSSNKEKNKKIYSKKSKKTTEIKNNE